MKKEKKIEGKAKEKKKKEKHQSVFKKQTQNNLPIFSVADDETQDLASHLVFEKNDYFH